MSDPTDQLPEHAEPEPLGAKLRTYLAIPLAALAFNSGFFLVRNQLPNYLRELGLAEWAGPMQAVLPGTSLLLALPLGVMSDRQSPRRLAIAGTLCFCLFALLITLFGEAPAPWMLLAGYILCGLSVVVLQNTVRPLYMKCIGARRQGLKLAAFSAAGMLGFGAGNFLAGLGYRLFGWTIAEQFRLALPLGVVALLAAVAMPNSSPTPFSFAAYRRDVWRRPVLLFLALVFINAMHFGIEAVCLAPFIERVLGMDDFGQGLYFGTISLCLAASAIATGWLREHAGNRHRMWVGGLLGSAVFNIAVAMTAEPWQFFVLRYLHVIADATLLVASLQIVAELFPRSRVGGPLGLMALMQTVGTMAGSLVAGWITVMPALSERMQLSVPFVVAGGVVLAGVTVQLAMRERL